MTLPIARTDSVYSLGIEYITPGSEIVLFDSAFALKRSIDYEVQYQRGILTLKSPHFRQLLSDTLKHTLFVALDRLPFTFRSQYLLREIVPSRDSSEPRIRKVQSPSARINMEDIFGAGLQKSGSIFRGLQIGSNQDLTLHSGFRMQLSGKLSSDLDIVAALTDENVPLQPEGTTQTLQELDKVFIELRNPKYSATLGDFVYGIGERTGGEFGRLSRKLQGATGFMKLPDVFGDGSSLAVTMAGATARGKFTTNQFHGTEGNQGPYRLSGENPGTHPIVIAGTERVYIDGLLLTRGETNDYTIDYSTGEVYFAAKRLITNATRITVDFEYSDRQFTRNLVGATVDVDAWNNRVHFSSSVVQEADDPGSPIDFALTDSLRAIIGASGSNRFKASMSGIQDVGRDSITAAGKGQYLLRDTLIAGKTRSFLVYGPGNLQAVYSATFSFVNQVPSDSLGYDRGTTGGYVLAGLGKGSYLPVQFLPVPELHRVVTGLLNVTPTSDVTVAAEYAVSSTEVNRLSTAANIGSQGGAYKLRAEYHPKDLNLGGTHLGELGISMTGRFVDHRFVSLDRSNEIEFNRAWNLDPSSNGDESIREIALNYLPIHTLKFSGTFGSLERTGSIRSDRSTFAAALTDTSAPRVSYASEHLSTEDDQSMSRSSWIRQRGTLLYPFSWMQPSVRVELEDRQQKPVATDSLTQGSFRYLEVAPGFSFYNIGPLRMSAELQVRTEDSASNGSMTRAFRSVTQLYDMQMRQWNSLSGSVSLSLRRSELSDEFAMKGFSNNNTMLIRSQVRYAPLRRALDAEVLYEFAREKSAAMRRIYILVPKGTGNYRYLGDTNHNALADDNEFEQVRFDGDYVATYVPGDNLVPVSDLKTGLRFRLSGSALMPQRTTFLEKVVAALSTETVARVEENSTTPDPSDVYFLHLSQFRNDSTTIAGTDLFTQDVYLFESDPSFSLRFRYNERKGLLRLQGMSERTYMREQSVRVRTQLVKEIANQTDFTKKVNELFPSAYSPRQRDLSSSELRTEFSYRPYPEWEVSFGTSMSAVTNHYGGADASATTNEQFIHLTYSLLSLGQLRSELQREEVNISSGQSNSAQSYSFEFTNGKVLGKTFLWRCAFDYRVSQFVQITVDYNGRSEGGGSAVHTGRAEARAFF